jgi:hypothetical protein
MTCDKEFLSCLLSEKMYKMIKNHRLNTGNSDQGLAPVLIINSHYRSLTSLATARWSINLDETRCPVTVIVPGQHYYSQYLG